MNTREDFFKKRNKIKNIKNIKIKFSIMLIILILIFIILFLYRNIFILYLNKTSIKKDLKNITVTNDIFIDKIELYSSANAVDNNINSQNSSLWNLDLSQYTDIAIHINSTLPINQMYIDNISFDNTSFNLLKLYEISLDNFGIFENNSPSSENSINNNNNTNQETKINLPLITPITIRYVNYNFEKGKEINNISFPLLYDGSILKNAKIPLHSLKNNINFTINIITNSDEHYKYSLKIPIVLRDNNNEINNKSIYDGYYYIEIPYNNAFFYKQND